VEAAAAAAGLEVALQREVTPRWNRDQPVRGHLFVLARPAEAEAQAQAQ
jgi:hypothetical protein